MIKVNMYGLMPNKRIQTDNIPIYRSYKDLLSGMSSSLNTISDINKDKYFSYAFPIELLKDYETRVRLFASIPNMITNEEVKEALLRDGSKFQIKTYLILPSGESMIVRNFDKIYENLSKIEQIGINNLKSNDKSKKETFEQFRDRMLSIKNNASTVGEVMIATTGLAYIYELIDQYIEDHRTELQNNMYASIKEIREEQEENEELSTELEMINKHAKTVLKDDIEDQFLQCIYNGEEITQEEMIKRLNNHMLYKEDIINEDQVYIADTLDDEYRIETEKLVITREYGGSIKVCAK